MGLELMQGSFRDDMIIGTILAVSMNWGPVYVGALEIRALLFGVYTRALIFGNSKVLAWKQ